MALILYAASYSPWSERARWALDHHGIEYREKEYVPMVGEPLLRLRARKWRGKITVPVLVGAGEALVDSVDIARWADRHGKGAPLFPAGREETIDGWIALSNELLEAGRARLMPRLLADPEAIRDSVPRVFPRAIRGLLVPVARATIQYIQRKHAAGRNDMAAEEARMRRGLARLREGLAGGREHLLDGFTFADITCAVALQFRPVTSKAIRVSRGSQRAWTDEALAADHEDLLAWRDRLYGGRFLIS